MGHGFHIYLKLQEGVFPIQRIITKIPWSPMKRPKKNPQWTPQRWLSIQNSHIPGAKITARWSSLPWPGIASVPKRAWRPGSGGFNDVLTQGMWGDDTMGWSHCKCVVLCVYKYMYIYIQYIYIYTYKYIHTVYIYIYSVYTYNQYNICIW